MKSNSFSFFSIFTGASTYSCKSPTGADVDWFVAYKLPISISNGTSFLYADSKNGQDWTLSKANIEDETSAIGRTILQIFEAKKAKTDLIALYNDENPNDGKTDSGRAHMKKSETYRSSDTESNAAENAEFDQLDEMSRDKNAAPTEDFLEQIGNKSLRRLSNAQQLDEGRASSSNAAPTEDFLEQIGNKSLRRLSNASLESGNESLLNAQAVPNSIRLSASPLNDISSDTESNAAENAEFDQLDEMPRDKLNAIFQRFQAHNASNVQRVTAAWKGRFDRQEEEWNRRISECEEKATIAIATSKADMHSALQQKDQELENWISKFHALEKKDTEENTQLKEKLSSLEEAILTLEQEKANMVQKLSQAKQEGVKLVKESEERKYNDALAVELKKRDEEWGARLKEMEDQMQLSVEENDMQRKTSHADHERITSSLRERIVELEKNNASVLLKLHEYEEELDAKTEELCRLAKTKTNDKEVVINESTGAHTNSIESSWRHAKESFSSHGRKKEHVPGNLARSEIENIEAGYKKLQEAPECRSLLKKTKLGANLLDVIQSGVANLDSAIGVYAPDAESYTLFKPLFDPIIQDYHNGFGPDQKQPQPDFGEGKTQLLPDLDPEGKIIISTRVQCGRSLQGYPFNPYLTKENYTEIQDKVKGVFDQLKSDAELGGTYYPLEGMTKEVQTQSIKNHFLFKKGDRFLQAANACRYAFVRNFFLMKSNRFIISSFFLFGFCLLLSFSFFSIFTGASTYSCKSPTGADVDWFVAYKLPNSISNGTSFLYADSKNGQDWTLSKANIEDETSAIGRTILQIFEAKKAKTDLIALYNDENPNDGKTDSGRAHMK
uniref:arginine kinase n=1 Tax=Meloidogyne javanica TaxID=6303 RepID=A0A915LRS2_MELJA